ncbi:hypothetical protein ABFY48_05850 [Lysinibacillus pakistanensis]|uniref:hypothetical protein n=1 Tax=Lysinibacillus TaxID=400634 RepID=UPI00257E0347|nr:MULTISPECIES: hypothetical protein [Lysinibacillus]
MEKIILTEMKQVMKDFGEVFSMINQGKVFENETNVKECINKCKKLQLELMDSIRLIELTFMELQSKRDQALLATESDSESKLRQLDDLLLAINKKTT